MYNKYLYTSFHDYAIEQIHDQNVYLHHFYKNGKMLTCRSREKCIPRSTKKQLYRYLRYLVNTGLIKKLGKPIEDGRKIPIEFDEVTNNITYHYSTLYKNLQTDLYIKED